ncbi:TonB-dependent receptor [Maribellus mangrovi]|uniref:TonB-dependent receptor n=1 Tax=Maribellus mangrovi TaxID=3133146 RepID=UPI0030EC33E6
MRFLLSALIVLIFSSATYGQAKKRGQVKRKYRNTESVSRELPPVFVRGAVYDENYVPLPGAHVTVDGTSKGVNTNEDGEYLIQGLVTGRARVRVSYIGYETHTVDIILRTGQNEKNVMMQLDNVHLEPVLVNAQKREQQIMDVPTAISSITDNTLEQSNITELSQLSEFVPGLYIREQGANRPTFVIRGLTSDEVSPSAQPRVSVYFNGVPINRASGASLELYDMERVEIMKGPQNTLFGRGAQAGALHYVSKMPTSDLYGSLTAGIGEFGQKEVRGFVNVPIFEDVLMVRAAGIYSTRDGYIENTLGGKLMGKETLAGRFSTRFRPAWNHRANLVLNYQKDNTPGIAFMPGDLPNTNGDIGIFSGAASHEQGNNLGTGKELFDATLNYRFYINEQNYWTSITSYRKLDANARWDGDGTASAAIDMAETSSASQFYQEIRGNFSNSRLNGVLGASYWREKADQRYWFSTNEQHLANLLLASPPMPLVDNSGQPLSIQAIPSYDPELDTTIYIPLPTSHQEENYSEAKNMAAEAFLDITYQLTRKIFVSAGIRGVYDRYKLANEASFAGGEASTLGSFTGNYPNVLFLPNDRQEIKKSSISFTWRGGLKYRFNEYGNVFANYARGRRPNVLQFTSSGEEEILDAEILDNFELGVKGVYFDRVYVDVTGFYQLYKNFQTQAWEADPESGEFNLKFKDSGQATSYGAEANLRVAIIKQLDFFANYAWLKTAFDSTDVNGSAQEYSGNVFRMAPEHSFNAGFSARINILPTIKLFVTPSYAWKSHIFFEDANTPGLEQDAYGTLNINGGIAMSDPNIIFSVWATNVLDEQFITSAGNTGSLFGAPTFVPGPPRMVGAKLTWNFSKKEKRRSRIYN